MGQLVDVEALAERQGLTIVKVVKEDYDHNVYLVDQDGEPRILKTINAPELRRNLEREIAYSALLSTLGATVEPWTLRVSVPLATGDGWMLREVVDAPPLLSPDDLGREGALSRVGRALADLDRLSPDPKSARPAYRDGAGEPVLDQAHRMEELARWVAEIDDGGGLGELDAGRLLHRLADDRPRVQPGLEVWDVKFDDFLDLPDGQVGVYDLEFAHLYGRRHYDTARLYGTLAVPFAAPGAAADLLRAYVDASYLPADVIAPACVPVLMEALLAALYDATGEESPERQARAQEQLVRCLSGGLEALTAG